MGIDGIGETRVAFTLSGGVSQCVEMCTTFQRALEPIKPVEGMELFCLVSSGSGNSRSVMGQNVAKRFGLVSVEIAKLAMAKLVQEGCPYGGEFAEASEAFLLRSAGFMSEATFSSASFYPAVDFSQMAMTQLGQWLVGKKGVSGGCHYGPGRNREHELWTLAQVVWRCLHPGLYDQVAGVLKYYGTIAYSDDFREQRALTEETIARCLRDLFESKLGNCFVGMVEVA